MPHTKPTRRQMKILLTIGVVSTFALWMLGIDWGVMIAGTGTNVAWIWELE